MPENFYKQPMLGEGGQQYPRLQILTVGELLAGQRIKYPSVGYLNVTFKQAPKAKAEAPEPGVAAVSGLNLTASGRVLLTRPGCHATVGVCDA